MKRIATLLLFMSVFTVVFSQPTAYKGGNYTGVYGVFSNPANIASNPRKWDVSLFSVSAMLANDQVKVGLSDLDKDFKDELFGREEKSLSALANVEVVGPSFMFRIKPLHTLAFTTRARTFGNIGTLNTRLAQAISNAKDVQNLPYDLNTGTQKLTVNSWSEIGVSWGGVILKKGLHSLKAGATLKYLRGIGNSFAHIQDINATLNSDINQYQEVTPYLTNGTGSLLLVNSGLDMLGDELSGSDFTKSNGNGFGLDLGFVYEYKEKLDTVGWRPNCSNSGYKFKAGIALLDVGSIKYKTVESSAFHYTLDIPQGEKFYLNELEGSVAEMQAYLDKSPYAKKEAVSESYKPSLPTALSLMVDYYWGNHFFTELSGLFSLVAKDKKPENAYCYDSFTLTPRFEGTYWGIYIPLNYNTLSDFNAGITLRAGPLMIGSGSIVSSLLSENKQADVFVGVRFGM